MKKGKREQEDGNEKKDGNEQKYGDEQETVKKLSFDDAMPDQMEVSLNNTPQME